MTTTDFPTLRLKPKADARRIRHGAPWVYKDDLVLDRRSRAIAAGAVARLEDSERAFLAWVAVNPESKIAARVLDRQPDATIGSDWIRARIARALALRNRLFDTPFYRLVHAEGDGLPGLIVDRFGDLCVVQPNTAWIDRLLPDVVSALQSELGAQVVLKNASGRARAMEGLDDASDTVLGTRPDAPLLVRMNGATYLADVTEGQKTGLFFDQRPNHRFAASMAKGARVLDVFSHVGGFALAALAAGAKDAVAVDASAEALRLAVEGAEHSGFADQFSTRQGDAFDVLAALQSENDRFGLVVCDPPAFAPHKGALTAGLRAYERIARLAAPLVDEGGTLVLCSCSHAATLEKFRAACLRGIGRAGREGRLIYTGFAGPDHPQHPYLAETGYLKALAFSL